MTLRHRQTGATRVVTTALDGSYKAADLVPGLYTVSADVAGFASGTRKDVRVAAGETATADFTLEARLEEALTVTGTRVRGRTALETPAPVDVIDASAIQSTGATETGKILQLLAPSVNFSTTLISDGLTCNVVRGPRRPAVYGQTQKYRVDYKTVISGQNRKCRLRAQKASDLVIP